MSQNNDAITQIEGQVDRGSQLRELDEALLIARQALDLQSPLHSIRSESINNLAAALRARYQQGGQHGDLNEAILLDKQALELRSSPHPLRSESLHNLGVDLWELFIQSGQQRDLNEAISLYRQALELRPPTNPHRPDTLNNLALALLILFWQGDQQDDFDEAFSLARQALELLAPSHPNQSDSIDIFAFALWTKFERGEGQESDLDEAISMHRQALNLRPSPHPLRSMSLNNLANALLSRFEHGFQQADLDEAISLFRQALELRPSPHPFRSVSLNDLAMALGERFREGGQRTDLDETILLHRQALELRISHKLLRAQSLTNLANALADQLFRQGQSRLDNIEEVKEVVSLSRQALELQLISSAPQSNLSLSHAFRNLANALLTQFSISRTQTLIDESISLHRQALELLSSTDPLRGRYLTDLGDAIWEQCNRFGHCQGIDEAISLHRQALELHSPLDGDQLLALKGLAKALGTRFAHEGDQSDFDESILLFRQAIELCHYQLMASGRLDIAYTWISHVNRYSPGHISLIDAFDAALQALPNLAASALSVDIKSRQASLLNGTGVLARVASKVAIEAGNVAKAIEFLEVGRAVFWSQFLSLRSPLEDMHHITPELAVKLQEIATELELGSHRDAMENMVDNSAKLIFDQETARLNRLNAEWSKTIEAVRCLDGFEDFLRPPLFILAANCCI